MREILFRGKQIEDGEWIEGFAIQNLRRNKAYIGDMFETVEVMPDTIGEYTGLTDKNGVKIFEDDILFDTRGETPKIYSVIWADGAFMIRSKEGYCFSLNALNAGEFEVTGNIHDNAELIGGTA